MEAFEIYPQQFCFFYVVLELSRVTFSCSANSALMLALLAVGV
jgi:hypothetical protein